jgi:hypothetical protein
MKVFLLRDEAAEIPSVGLLLQPGVNEVDDVRGARLLEISGPRTPEQIEAGALPPLCREATPAEAAAFDEARERERAEAEKAANPKKAAPPRRSAEKKE